MRRLSSSRGFTLIELLITLAILGMLASLALPVTQTVMKRHKEQELRSDLQDMRRAIDLYKQAYDDGHIQKTVGGRGYPPDLDILVKGVPDQTDPTLRKMYFLRRIPRDPTNKDLTLAPEESWGKRCYDSDADDPTEGNDVFDVYSKSAESGLDGTPYNAW